MPTFYFYIFLNIFNIVGFVFQLFENCVQKARNIQRVTLFDFWVTLALG